jgi:hypothetical protein
MLCIEGPFYFNGIAQLSYDKSGRGKRRLRFITGGLTVISYARV